MLFLICAAFVVLADQLLKIWVVNNIPLDESINFIPGIIQLAHVHNYAAAFSLFRNMQLPIIILTFLVCAAIIAALILKKPESKAQRLALALILGGAVGNLIDRLAEGYVVDMFETTFISFPVFNIADCAIVIGGILICIFVFAEENVKTDKKVPPISDEEESEIFEKLKRFSAVYNTKENDSEDKSEIVIEGKEPGNDPSDISGC